MQTVWNLTGSTVRNASGFAIADLVFGTDEQRAEHGAMIAAAPAMLAALQSVAKVMDMADPESDNFADSAADCLDALLNDCSDVVRILLDFGLPLDGTPTAQPAGDYGAAAAANLSRSALVEAAAVALTLE